MMIYYFRATGFFFLIFFTRFYLFWRLDGHPTSPAQNYSTYYVFRKGSQETSLSMALLNLQPWSLVYGFFFFVRFPPFVSNRGCRWRLQVSVRWGKRSSLRGRRRHTELPKVHNNEYLFCRLYERNLWIGDFGWRFGISTGDRLTVLSARSTFPKADKQYIQMNSNKRTQKINEYKYPLSYLVP